MTPGIGTRFGTQGPSIGPHRGRSTTTAEFPAPTGLLVEPDFYLASVSSGVGGPGNGGADDGERGKPGSPGTGPGPAPPGVSEPVIPSVTQFYAQFDIDPVRAIKQLGQILESVSARLGPNIELSLEIRANKADGYDDDAQRIVSENATNLGASASEFE